MNNRLAWKFGVAAVLIACFVAGSAMSEDAAVTRGLDWLQARVTANGALDGEGASLAIVEQARTEAAHTLASAGRTTALPDLAPSQVSDLSTELLSRRMIALAATGRSASELLPVLVARANDDGGFGGAAHQPSNALDTSLALLAMRAGGLTRDTRIAAALAWLDGAAGTDGRYAFGQPTYTTAYALQAFQRHRASYALNTPIQRTRTALLALQGAGGYSDPVENAVATIALAQSGAIADAAPAATALRNAQASNGSWQDDPYVTALALRALQIASAAPSTNAGQIVGEVYDASTGRPLEGAQAVLSAGAFAATSAAQTGAFSLENVPAGQYTLTVSHAGYGAWSGNVQVQGDTTTNVGRVRLALLDDTASLRGRVTDAANGAPLAGVSVQVAGPLAMQTTTDADGQYALLGLPVGTYSVAFVHAGYRTLSQSVSLPARTAVTFSPALGTEDAPLPTQADVAGLVVDGETNAPIAGATLAIGTRTATSGVDGRLVLDALESGPFAGTVQAAGFDAIALEGVLANGPNDLGRIALSRTGNETRRTLVGTVVSRGGAPIAGAELTLNGAAAGVTDADGQYRIEDTLVADVTLSVAASGYKTSAATTRLENPGTYRLDVALDPAEAGTFQVLNLRAASTAKPGEVLHITADVANLADEARPALVLVRVFDGNGDKVAQFCGGTVDGGAEQCDVTFDVQQTTRFVADWTVPNLATGPYQLAVHVVKPGSVSRDTPLGLVYGSDSRALVISPVLGLQGTIVPSPPVMIPGSPNGVDFTALVQNAGNAAIPAGDVVLKATDKDTGVVAFTATTQLPELPPNDIATLDFGHWQPEMDGAQFDLTVTAVDTTVGGAATGTFYVGDAASGEFTVTPTETHDGTQRVEATLTVQGIDHPTGQAADPLFTMVRQAVARGGGYTSVESENWQATNLCLGCHIQTQSLYGLASSLGKAEVDRSAALYLQNTQMSNIQPSRAIYNEHPQFPKAQSLLGLWSMATWPDTAESFNARLRVAKYVWSVRTNSGTTMNTWSRDHDTGWLVEGPAATATAVQGLAAVVRDAAKHERTDFAEYTTQVRYQVGARLLDIASGPDGLLYVVREDRQVFRIDPQTGAVSFYGSAPQGRYGYAITVADNGDVYVATSLVGAVKATVWRIKPTGSEPVFVLPEDATAIDVMPDGKLAILYYNSRRVFIGDPATGTLTLHTSGNLIPAQARSITALADGSLIVTGTHQSGNRVHNTVRVATNGTQSLVYRGRYYHLTDVVVGPNGALMGSGGDAVFELGPNGTVERFRTDGNNYRVAYVGDRLFGIQYFGTTTVSEITRTSAAIDADIEAFRLSIEKGARAYQNTVVSGIPSVAFQLMLFAESRPYVQDPVLLAKIDTRIPQLRDQLRNAQHADGGWSRFANQASDPLTTSIVGTALDYTAPAPTDPVLRKTVQYLLTHQDPEGSWTGEYFTTKLGATSYVMAYLPKAVSRLGGIDTGLGLEFGPDVKLVDSSVAATSSTVNADGSSSYFFDLGRVTSSVATFKFTLDLVAMKIDEVRKIATRAFLRFVNGFTGETVESPIAIPTVHAGNGYVLDLALNATVFRANETVSVQPTVRNTGSTYTSGSLRYFIETTEGTFVAELPTVGFANLASGTQRTLPQPWDTGTHAAGDYRARVVLLGPDGQTWGEAIQPFRILTTSTGPQLDSNVATDRAVYDPFDTVSILGKVHNLTLNGDFAQLTVVEVVTDANGIAVFTGERAIDKLVADTTFPLSVPYRQVAAPMGPYTVTQSVRNADGDVLDVATAQFEVRSSVVNGAGVGGEVAALPPSVEQGEATSLLATVRNAGNAGFDALPTILSVVDPATESVLATWTQDVALPVGGTASYAKDWDTDGIVPGTYQVVLQARLASGLKTLAHGPVTVTLPPQKIAMAQALASTGRVLVLMTCRIGTGAAEDAACTADRAAFVDALLTDMGIEHRVVTTTDAFAREYATGRYDTYWVSGGAQKLANTLAEEVREAVFQGDGLVVDGAHDSRNQILDTALGVKFTGQLAGDRHAVRTVSGIFDVGAFAAPGDALHYVPEGAVVHGRFDADTGTAALLAHLHGDGRAVVAAFDWVAALRDPATATQTRDLLARTLRHVLPPTPTYGLAGGYVAVRTDVQNQAGPVDLWLHGIATPPLRIEDGAPAPDVLDALQARWQFLLGAGETRTFRFGLRLPYASGQYRLDTTAGTGARLLAEQSLQVTVAAPRELAGVLVDDLQALALPAAERNARTRVIALVESALVAQASGKRDAAVAELMKAIEELAKIQSVNTAPHHVQLAVLVKLARIAPAP